jgi:hypothetical protein
MLYGHWGEQEKTKLLLLCFASKNDQPTRTSLLFLLCHGLVLALFGDGLLLSFRLFLLLLPTVV